MTGRQVEVAWRRWTASREWTEELSAELDAAVAAFLVAPDEPLVDVAGRLGVSRQLLYHRGRRHTPKGKR